MRSNEQVLQLHPVLSRLLSSLCMELSVNVPDQNSLTLLDILSWRRQDSVTEQQFRQLYKSWLQAKNIFDLFSARQITTYPKHQLHCPLTIGDITVYLEILNAAYNQLYLERRSTDAKILAQIQSIFSLLDGEGVIHLRLSEMFFLTGALLICENYALPTKYEGYKVHFRELNQNMCEVGGVVSLRWFKNYLLNHPNRSGILKHLKGVVQEIGKVSALLTTTKNKGLPNIMEEAFVRWAKYGRFAEERKKIDIYRRVFEENQSIFFFNDEMMGNESYFVSKYGESFVSCVEINNTLLRQFSEVVREVLGEYVVVLVKASKFYSKHRQSVLPAKERNNGVKAQISRKDKTPTKGRKNEGRQVTPTHRPFRSSPTMQNHSAEKVESALNKTTATKKNRDSTPTRANYQVGFGAPQTYKAAGKVGIPKDSFFEKMFFFRNKRVESYQVVMRRLKGR